MTRAMTNLTPPAAATVRTASPLLQRKCDGGMAAGDEVTFELAAREERVVVSADNDFGGLR